MGFSTTDKRYYLADKFKAVTECREPAKAEKLIGEFVYLTVTENGDVTSLKLNNKEIYSFDDVQSESTQSGVVSLLIGLAFVLLLLFKRNAT